MGSRTSAPEGLAIAEAKANELSALSWEELDSAGKQVDDVTAPSGRRFLVKSHAFWDMDEWASDMNVIVKAYPVRGWRRFWPYKAVGGRRGEDLPSPSSVE